MPGTYWAPGHHLRQDLTPSNSLVYCTDVTVLREYSATEMYIYRNDSHSPLLSFVLACSLSGLQAFDRTWQTMSSALAETKSQSHGSKHYSILLMPRSRPFIASPVKQCDPKKMQTIVHLQRIEKHRKHLEEKISQLLNPPSVPSQSDTGGDGESASNNDPIEAEGMNVGEQPIHLS